MNVISSSKWDLAQIPGLPVEAGISPLIQFASTEIPRIESPSAITSIEALKGALQNATASVRRVDLCANIGDDQSQLEIIPFKEIPNVVKAGDVVSFVTLNDAQNWKTGDANTMIDQRGWHSEIIAPRQNKLIFHGQWHGDNMITPIEDAKQHPHYHDWPSYWNLHIFRFSPPKNEDGDRFSSLIEGLEAWGNVFPQTTWPPNDASRNPVMFSDVAGLMKLGDSLIQKSAPLPNMVCIEWVHAIFSLACCYPLTKKFLASRGILPSFMANFPSVPLLDDSLDPFNTLPWAPYQPSYIIRSFLDTYFEEDLSETIIQALPEVAQIPSPVIMPIAPLLEMRRKGNPLNFNVSYVCTAVADEYCVAR